MNKLSKKYKLILFIGVLLLLCAVGSIALNLGRGNVDIQTLEPLETESTAVQAANAEEKTIQVHIKGAVNAAGLYTLPEGARIHDAIEAAGGAAENAKIDDVNLAMALNDGDELNIPDNSGGVKKPVVSNAETEVAAGSSARTAKKINLNTASAADLEKIPGVGEAMAKKIISYRETTPFKRIEDIMKIGGVGQKKFESMKEYIEV